ncbi:outer membrane beta-barrel protein [Alistipes sp.]|uniref:outer membrane beta-barrel protein n=1 Tax=Alistipes sp. TaxID=1872444 RepID=UPI003AB2EED4
MKRLILLIVILASAVSRLSAARLCPSTGRVVDEQGNAVEYATVVLLKGSEQVAGRTTDAQGRFELKAAPGNYTLQIQFLGFDPIKKAVRVELDNDLGDFVMRSSATDIEGVVVKAQLVRREADRFVVDVANAPAAIGKDGIELLERAPGVWIDGEKISINGKSGSKVYINDRELRMEPEQLLTYLRSLRAEEIQKIEVVPTTGADYDADSAGGIIRITLKKRRENGIDGSVSFNTSQAEIVNKYNPSANINIHSGRTDFYASAWGSFGGDKTTTDEQTRYDAADKALNAHSEMKGRNRSFGASAGTVFEINPRHSVGAEFEYWRNRDGEPNDSYTDFRDGGTVTRTDSYFDKLDRRNNYSATFNYIWKIDTLGSTLKLLADYTRRENDTRNDNTSRITAPGGVLDSVYRDNSASLYNITTATLALEKNFSPRWSLKAGAKYTYNDMHNNALYEYRKGDAWLRNEQQSFTIDYTENIAAAYGIVSAKLGDWSLVAGLRGEYTHTTGKGVGQDYFSLFPNANVSYSFSREKGWSLIAQYARTIERPRFWSLNPQRMQISDYTYQTGNPSLDPAFRHDVSLTLVMAHKYTLTGGVQLVDDEIQQTMRADPENPDLLQLAWVNYDATKGYYLSANLPFQPTKWWQLNADITYMRRGQRVEQHGAEEFFNWGFVNLSTTFTLPAKFYIDLSYRYQTRLDLGNCWVEPDHRLQAGIKKRFGDRFTASFSVQNLLDQGQVIGARGDGFVRTVNARQTWSNRSYRIGVTWNFKSGKAFKRKAVEAGSEAEKSRL